MGSFQDTLKTKTPLLFDGAIGTELYKRGIFINRCFEDANLSNPDLLLELHRDYLKAGANILSTNSWGANRLKLKEHNLDDKLELINTRAVELVKKAIGHEYEAFIAGCVGPLGVHIEPMGSTSYIEAQEIFAEQISALTKAGVDLISLETFSNLSEIQQAIQAARKVAPHLPIIAHVTVTTEGTSPLGTPALKMLQKLEEWGVDVVGLNCSVGPQPLLTCIEKVVGHINKPICIQPNAGLPKGVDGRQIYMSTPEYMAHFTKEFLQVGVQIVGGCCGTSPEHIQAMANTIRYSRAVQHSSFNETTNKPIITGSEEHKALPRIPLAEKSVWSKKIAEGKLVTSIELLPPSGVDPSQIIERSRKIKLAGVDAINIPDGPRASARMSAILTAVMIEQEAGIETVLHYTCRDRNLLGMQSDMLGAHAIKLRNILAITGDPPKMGSYPNATGVFDVDSIGLTNMLHQLNGGLDLGGRSIGQVACLSIGVGVNPAHHDFDYEIRRFAWKVEAGAEWAITQPVFDSKVLFHFLETIDKMNIRIPIIVGAWPLTSYRNALFMNNEVPGIVIPDKIMERMAAVKDAEDGQKTGIDIARAMIAELKNHVAGFQVSAPFGRIEMALDVLGL